MSDSRREEIVRAASELLESEGRSGLSTRRLASQLGMRAPSLYKHVPDNAALEAEIIAEGPRELGDTFAATGSEIPAQAGAYPGSLSTTPSLRTDDAQPLPRDRLSGGLEQQVSRPIIGASGDEHPARAARAAAHGLASLELARRFPPHADLDAAWAAMVRALTRASARPSCLAGARPRASSSRVTQV